MPLAALDPGNSAPKRAVLTGKPKQGYGDRNESKFSSSVSIGLAESGLVRSCFGTGAVATASPEAAGGAGSQQGARQHGDREGRGRPVFGKISAIQSNSLEITEQDGTRVTLKLTSDTQFRKDRQPAKLRHERSLALVFVRQRRIAFSVPYNG